jgi:hypothetical protein
MEPVVNDKIIFSANTKLQLKTTGLTKKIAIPVLSIRAQPKVKYLVYLLICCLPNSPSSFCKRSNAGKIGVNS